MGSKRNVDMSANEDKVKIVEAPTEEKANAPEAAPETLDKAKSTKKKIERTRGKKYQLVRSQVDKTRSYDPFAAVEMVKRLSYSKFEGSFEAHLVVRDTGTSGKIKFPHSTGKSITVAIADDKVLQAVEDGNIDFDVLIATPDMMPKLTKYARVLGPKGLMPNPKNGTLTDKPEAKKKELEAGSVNVKTEKKAPLMHLSFGKTSMETKQLVENLEAIFKALKGQVLKCTICASMSPGVKVEVTS